MRPSLITFLFGIMSMALGFMNLFVIKGTVINDYIGIFNICCGAFMIMISFKEVKP